MTPTPSPKRRRSALEAFDGCPYRYDVLYNTCLCGHRRKDHDEATGECCGQVTNPIRGKSPLESLQEDTGIDLGQRRPKMVPCDCTGFRPVEDRGNESQRGIAFHEIAFRYITRLVEANTSADAEEADLAYQEGIALTQLAPHLLKDVGRLWGRFSARFQLDLRAYLSAEERQETDRFTWIPDLVYIYPRRVRIIDWKTYYKGLTEEQARSEFQLKFYMVQAKDIWPNFEEYEFTFYFVRLGYEVSIVFTPDEIEEFRPEIEAIDLTLTEAERTDNWPAIQGSHCNLCRLKCPLADNPMKLPVRLLDRPAAEAAAGRLLSLKQEVKALQRILDAWCLTEGPLVYRGEEFAHRPQVSRKYPAADFIEFMKARGVDVSDIELTRGALGDHGKPKKAGLAVLEWLTEHERAVTRWSFTNRKAGELSGGDDVLGGDDDDSED